MAQHNIAATVLVFNDSAYGNVKRIQEQDLGGRQIASELRNPDYLKLADAFGVAGRQATSPKRCEPRLKSRSRRTNQP